MPGATENSLEVVRAFRLNLLLLKSTIPSKPGALGEGGGGRGSGRWGVDDDNKMISSKFFLWPDS